MIELSVCSITPSPHANQQKGKITIGTEVEHDHNKEREEHPSLDTSRFSKERLLHVTELVDCIGYVVLKHGVKNSIAEMERVKRGYRRSPRIQLACTTNNAKWKCYTKTKQLCSIRTTHRHLLCRNIGLLRLFTVVVGIIGIIVVVVGVLVVVVVLRILFLPIYAHDIRVHEARFDTLRILRILLRNSIQSLQLDVYTSCLYSFRPPFFFATSSLRMRSFQTL